MKEQWKIIDEYPNYQVSDLGRVMNKKTGRVLNLDRRKDGYLQVDLLKDGKKKLFLVHRLVATAFIENPYNKPCVNHIDGCKSNNYVENLEWCSHSENMKHSYRTGLKKITIYHNLNPKQSIRCIETNQVFESQHDAARYFGCAHSSIRDSIYKGCRCKGFHFEKI